MSYRAVLVVRDAPHILFMPARRKFFCLQWFTLGVIYTLGDHSPRTTDFLRAGINHFHRYSDLKLNHFRLGNKSEIKKSGNALVGNPVLL